MTTKPNGKQSKEERQFEENVYTLLLEAFHNEENAAKAVARLEFDIVERYRSEQAPPTDDAEELDPEADNRMQASREFASAQFQTLFTNLNVLKLTANLIDLMGLHDLQDGIMQTMIADMFGREAVQAPGSRTEGQTFIGNDMEVMMRNMREAAARAQRNKKMSEQ